MEMDGFDDISFDDSNMGELCRVLPSRVAMYGGLVACRRINCPSGVT